ncbi:hypothetical protein GMOD_00004206 [Pyrenophora seminiperda CCB06]|uniref:Uncharacterized protein n=1 Tax=Pyrenophora seminiperda CCB06 TaxID=1302712 RepID=A0A3M7M0S5_9PLEO|nr:hypothetical protein GMOD_00004206 [Pyrenophora seminiperda CCB06]
MRIEMLLIDDVGVRWTRDVQTDLHGQGATIHHFIQMRILASMMTSIGLRNNPRPCLTLPRSPRKASTKTDTILRGSKGVPAAEIKPSFASKIWRVESGVEARNSRYNAVECIETVFVRRSSMPPQGFTLFISGSRDYVPSAKTNLETKTHCDM